MKLSNYMQLYNYNNQDTKQFPLYMVPWCLSATRLLSQIPDLFLSLISSIL